MKIRNSFVSNSSSTSFIFCFKGYTIDSLFSLLRKYGEYFNLSAPSGDWVDVETEISCDVEDVIDAIRSISIMPPIRLIGDVIVDVQEDIVYCIKNADKEEDQHWYKQWLNEYIQQLNKETCILQHARMGKLEAVIQIDFGDNHGDVEGSDVGVVMNYGGRNIYINKPDFVVYTRQNR